ncbi:MAG: CsbD family protein [Anaerolineales bacterium]
MNKDILAGNWKQLRGQVREQWGELTDDELDQIAGKRDQLIGKIQEKYGHTREKAENEVDEFLENNNLTRIK